MFTTQKIWYMLGIYVYMYVPVGLIWVKDNSYIKFREFLAHKCTHMKPENNFVKLMW